MNRRERVFRAINRQKTDRVPWGELHLPSGLIHRVMGSPVGLKEELLSKRRFLERFNLDLLVLDQFSQLQSAREEIRYWQHQSDFFVFLLFTGGFTRVLQRMGWKEFFIALAEQPKYLAAVIAGENRKLLAEMEPLLAEEADGIIIGDDISGQRPLVDPQFLRESVFPSLKELVQGIRSYREQPVLFHSDGNLVGLVDQVALAGFQGLQGMEPSAGMDLKSIKREHGGKLCLMGNLELGSLLEANETELEARVAGIMRDGAEGGGLIFSTTGGLVEEIETNRLETLSRLIERYGKYE